MALVSWDTIDNVPVHYARNMVPALRNAGRRCDFRSTEDFKAKLDATFAELWEHCGLGKADVIVSAGAYVNKDGMHGAGRALDVDGIIWHATDRRPERRWFAVDFAADAAFYWGVGGIFNRHMKWVLHAKYNRPHEDHYHIDDTHSPGFSTSSKSAVSYLQAAISHVHALPIAIDGVFGPQTNDAVATIMERLGIDGEISDSETWTAFNLATARLGMGATAAASVDDPDRRDQPVVAGEEVAPIGDHERSIDGETSAARRLRLTTPRMRGQKVKELQRALKAAGCDPGRVDGIFGSKTKGAVMDFQRRHELEVDGIVGPVTAGQLSGFTLLAAWPVISTRVLGPMSAWAEVPAAVRRVRAVEILTSVYGYSVNAAAGIVGNLDAESGVIPNRVQGSKAQSPMTSKDRKGETRTWTAEQVMNRTGERGPAKAGVGLAQWTFHTRRQDLFDHLYNGARLGASILFDMDAQIDYLVHELETRSEFRKANEILRRRDVTLSQAADAVLLNFERPGSVIDGTTAQKKKVISRRRELAETAAANFRDAPQLAA